MLVSTHFTLGSYALLLQCCWHCIALYLTERFSNTRENQTHRSFCTRNVDSKLAVMGLTYDLTMLCWDQGDCNALWFLSCLSWPWFDVSHDDISLQLHSQRYMLWTIKFKVWFRWNGAARRSLNPVFSLQTRREEAPPWNST